MEHTQKQKEISLQEKGEQEVKKPETVETVTQSPEDYQAEGLVEENQREDITEETKRM